MTQEVRHDLDDQVAVRSDGALRDVDGDEVGCAEPRRDTPGHAGEVDIEDVEGAAFELS